MGKTIVYRLLGLPILLFFLVTVVFLLVRLIPGDPALLMAGADPSPEQVETIRRNMGLDRPIWVQYGYFLANLLQGDLGDSLRSGRPALNWAFEAVQYSATLAVTSMFFAIMIGVSAGVLAAITRGSRFDTAIVIFSLIGVSVPVYLSAILFILIFGVYLGVAPIAGTGTVFHYILPSVSIGLLLSGQLARITRSAMLDVLSQDYMRTAQAKGVSYPIRVYKHGLRNASIPILSVAGEQFGGLFGAAVITETIFAFPGLGRLLVDAIQWRDYPLIQSCMIVFGGFVILVNLATDIAYSVADPRLR